MRHCRTTCVGFPAILSRSLVIGCTAAALGGCGTGEPFAEPWVVVQPDTVMVTLEQGSGATMSRTVAVTNAGPGSLTGLDVETVYPEAQHAGWLAADLSSTTAPTTITLLASVNGLAGGAYEAAVVVRSPDAANDSAVVHVVCSVMVSQCTGPVMCLSATRLMFSAEAGTSPPAQAVGVFSCGCGRVIGLQTSVTYEEPGLPEWLSVKKNTWRTPAALSVQVSPALLASGSYHGIVVVSADTASNSPQTINVVFNVQ
jgi:hypothetical protein